MEARFWGQTKTKLFQEVVKLQNKAIQTINFLPFNSYNINKTLTDLKIPKLPDSNSLYICERLLCEKEIPIYQLP